MQPTFTRHLIGVIGALIIALTSPVFSQDQESKSPGNFSELIETPGKFRSEERARIYQNHISKYLATNIDSARLGYEEMAVFGQSIKDEFVTGVSYMALGSISQLQGDFKSSIVYDRKAIPFLKSKPKILANLFRGLGSAYIATNQLDSAEIYILISAEKTFDRRDSLEYSNAHLSLAQLYNAQGRFSTAIEEYQNALKSISLGPSKLREVSIHKKIASIYLKFNDVENSNYHLEKAIRIANESGFKSTANNLLFFLGTNKYVEKEYRLAYDLISKSYSEVKDKKDVNSFRMVCYLTRSAIHLGESDLVETYFQAVQETFSKDFTIEQDLFNLTSSEYFIYKKKYNTAIIYAEQLVLSEDETQKSKGFNALVKIYQGQENWKAADVSKDSVLALTYKSNSLGQQSIIYDYEKKYQKAIQDKEIASLTTNKEINELRLTRQSRMLLFSLLGLLLAGIAVLGFVYAFRIKTKNNILLQEKNEKLAEALSANKMLVKEIHHRVKNNLQVVSSLLNLQSRFEKDNTIVKAINTGKLRVQSMSLLHQNLYANEDLKSIHIKKYFEDLADSLVSGYPNHNIHLQTDIQDLVMDIDTVVPLGLITNELITNSLKYAFKDQETCNISLNIKAINNKVVVIVKDDGLGIPFTELPKRPTSMGFQLVQSFANKIKADIKIENENGTSFTLIFDNRPKKISHAVS